MGALLREDSSEGPLEAAASLEPAPTASDLVLAGGSPAGHVGKVASASSSSAAITAAVLLPARVRGPPPPPARGLEADRALSALPAARSVSAGASA